MLESGGYRSAPNYLGAIKERHFSSGFSLSDALAITAKHFSKTTLRGIGPARQSEALNLSAVWGLSLDLLPFVARGPVRTRNLPTRCSFFMLREIEGSLARAVNVTLNWENCSDTWRLPASKNDPCALGCARSWGCLCSTSSLVACPFHCAVNQHELLLKLFPSRVNDPSLPLFPESHGDAVQSGAMITVVETLAERIGEPLWTAAGQRRFGTHSWRATGAMYLSSLQLDLFKIQLLARWQSPIILHYVRLTPLSGVTAAVATLQTKRSLDEVSGDLTRTDGEVRDLRKTLGDFSASHLAEESALRLRVASLEALVDPRFIISYHPVRGHRYHMNVLEDAAQPDSWRTHCGWPYHAETFGRALLPPDEIKQKCKRCFKQ